jgi:hypothetical protein
MKDHALMAENVDNSLVLEILKEIRKEQRDQRTLLLLTAERVDRLDRHFERKFLSLEERMSSMKDDLAMMIKSELLGALTNFQNKIEIYVDQRLAERTE